MEFRGTKKFGQKLCLESRKSAEKLLNFHGLVAEKLQLQGGVVFQAGYHPGKRTFKTHPKHVFGRYELKIDPIGLYVFLHAFFLICPSCPFQNLSL